MNALRRTIAGSWVPQFLLGLFLSIGIVSSLMILEEQRPAAARALDLEYLPKGEYLRVAVLGYRQIAADLIWLKAVQHFGEKKQTSSGYRWAYHAVDVVTDLDPKFVVAYQAAGTILGVWAGQVTESIAILTKGMRHNPDTWRLPFLVGYDYFYELCDSAKAGEYFRQASTLPGSPEYLPRLAARMTVEGGDPHAALEFLARFAQQTQDERLRDALLQRSREVIAERDLRALEEAARRYTAAVGRPPTALDDLVRAGFISSIPPSPFEQSRYEWDASQGTVINTGLRERLQVHRHVSCRGSRPDAQTLSTELGQH